MRPLKFTLNPRQLALALSPIALLVGLLLSMESPTSIKLRHSHPNTGETEIHIDLARQ